MQTVLYLTCKGVQQQFNTLVFIRMYTHIHDTQAGVYTHPSLILLNLIVLSKWSGQSRRRRRTPPQPALDPHLRYVGFGGSPRGGACTVRPPADLARADQSVSTLAPMSVPSEVGRLRGDSRGTRDRSLNPPHLRRKPTLRANVSTRPKKDRRWGSGGDPRSPALLSFDSAAVLLGGPRTPMAPCGTREPSDRQVGPHPHMSSTNIGLQS